MDFCICFVFVSGLFMYFSLRDVSPAYFLCTFPVFLLKNRFFGLKHVFEVEKSSFLLQNVFFCLKLVFGVEKSIFLLKNMFFSLKLVFRVEQFSFLLTPVFF